MRCRAPQTSLPLLSRATRPLPRPRPPPPPPLPSPHSYKFTREDIKRKLAEKRERGVLVGGLLSERHRVEALFEAAQSAGDAEAAAA